MTAVEADVEPSGRAARWWRRVGSVEGFAAVIVAILVLRGALIGLVDSVAGLALVAVFASLVLQALPFAVLGAVLRAVLLAYPPAVVDRLLRRRLIAAALTAPTLSPVVLASTAVAFPGEPMLVLARLLAGVAAAVLAAVLWQRLGPPDPTDVPVRGQRDWSALIDGCRADIVRAGGVLVLGAAVVATLATALPPRWLDTLAAYPVVAIGAAALLAFLLCQRPETDAVLMAALVPFPLTARLVFLVVGPVVNLRTFARHNERYGPGLAVRYAPAALLAATAVAALAGWVLL
jgi:uncharacterized membrane protein YraQ (UPF0718 family)